MPVFTYRAINDDSKEVRGQIDAVDLAAATASLEDTHLDVVEIHEASRRGSEAMPEGSVQPVLKTTFAFEGTDATGTVRRGTVQAETKYQAFEKLKNDQKLVLQMLSPLGVTPQYRDNDLENWQGKEKLPTAQKAKEVVVSPAKEPVVPIAPRKPKPIVFSGVAQPVADRKPLSSSSSTQPSRGTSSAGYHPLVSTLRLYAGWLLAWYGLFVALGYYTHVRQLPWLLPFVEAFFISPLIFTVIVAIFLFLILGSIHRAIHGRWISRIISAAVGIGAFVGVRMSF